MVPTGLTQRTYKSITTTPKLKGNTMSTALALPQDFDPALAEMMGISTEQSGPSVARLAIQQTAIKGETEVNGKKIKMEVIPVGYYRLTLPNDTIVYAPEVEFRVFAKRQQWAMWDSEKNVMYKTVMANDLRGDLKDNCGTFNIGRPSGYIKDFDSLPKATKDIMRSVKRVNVVMGVARPISAVDEQGNPVDGHDSFVPCIMEVRSTQGSKNLTEGIASITRKNLLAIQYSLILATEISTKADGGEIGTLTAKLGNPTEVTSEDQETLRNFFDYISRTNTYILDKWKENNREELSDEDSDLVASIVNVEDAD